MKKTVLITGASRGIGLGIAKALGKSGYKLIVSATGDVLNESAKQELSQYDYVYHKCDISNESDINALYDFVKTQGPLYGLVNNAGVAPLVRTDIMQVGRESFDRVIDINLRGTFFMCQKFANLMVEQSSEIVPRIINISSCSSYTSSTKRGEYCISKAGISMVTSLFADRLAEYGIPVFEVRPGIILSDMTEAVSKQYEERIKEGLTPIKRMGKPEDVASCVKALMSGDFDFCTGQVINADGGFHIRRL